MDPNQDNPFIRFKAFWCGLGIFILIALCLIVALVFNPKYTNGLEDAAGVKRYETRAKNDKAQLLALSDESINRAIEVVSKELVSVKAGAVEKPDQLVPGAQEGAAPTRKTADSVIDPRVMEMGKASYMLCAACHGQAGEGGVIAPPLAGSEWVLGPASNLIRIQLRGLQGSIKVKGKDYHFPAGMAALAHQSDEQIAAVLTYVRNQFGNKASVITKEEVAALRQEVGKPPLTAQDLIAP